MERIDRSGAFRLKKVLRRPQSLSHELERDRQRPRPRASPSFGRNSQIHCRTTHLRRRFCFCLWEERGREAGGQRGKARARASPLPPSPRNKSKARKQVRSMRTPTDAMVAEATRRDSAGSSIGVVESVECPTKKSVNNLIKFYFNDTSDITVSPK